jgi:hypothetical protein
MGAGLRTFRPGVEDLEMRDIPSVSTISTTLQVRTVTSTSQPLKEAPPINNLLASSNVVGKDLATSQINVQGGKEPATQPTKPLTTRHAQLFGNPLDFKNVPPPPASLSADPYEKLMNMKNSNGTTLGEAFMAGFDDEAFAPTGEDRIGRGQPMMGDDNLFSLIQSLASAKASSPAGGQRGK